MSYPQFDYTGKERDAETGLDYFGARYLSAAQGRFTSPDPLLVNSLRLISPQRWNIYAYAVNNPLVFVDPRGRDAMYVLSRKEVSLGKVDLGHAGVLVVRKDGSVRYSRSGPGLASWSSGWAAPNTTNGKELNLPKIQFDSKGLPTPSSYAALANIIGVGEGQDPATIDFLYFKTTDAETLALEQKIEAEEQFISRHPLFPPYSAPFNNCADYAFACLRHGVRGVSEAQPTGGIVPTILYELLQRIADDESRGSDKRQREVIRSTFRPR